MDRPDVDLWNERVTFFADVQAHLVRGATDLFTASGLAVDYTPGRLAKVDGPAVMAVIGYASDDVRGALLLLGSCCAVAALEPPEMKHAPLPGEDVLRDVLGEFSNMLLGRIKNRLEHHVLPALVSTPTTVYGADLELPAPRGGMSAWHSFTAQSEAIFVRFDATFEPGFVLARAPRVGPVPAEGEVVMFDTPTRGRRVRR
jgi:CheY-specific phosphatase CheX